MVAYAQMNPGAKVQNQNSQRQPHPDVYIKGKGANVGGQQMMGQHTGSSQQHLLSRQQQQVQQSSSNTAIGQPKSNTNLMAGYPSSQ